ncbi:MAG: hypothetical protein WDW38_001573 [Sanguina aurantia]
MVSGLSVTSTSAAASRPALSSSGTPSAEDAEAAAQDLSGSSGRLQLYCQRLVEELGMAVEYLAVAEFNDWLVSVRTKAQRIGIAAIRRAAVQRQLDEELAAERKAVAALLAAGESSIAAIAEQLARSPFRVELHQSYRSQPSGRQAAPASLTDANAAARSQAAAGGGRPRPSKATPAASSASPALRAELRQLHVGEPQLAVQVLLERWRSGRGTAADGGSGSGTGSKQGLSLSMLEGVDMRGLFRCVHIQRSLGQLPGFRGYYLEQRRLQLTTDLTPPSRFLDSYQVYLSQVVGVSLVECYLCITTPNLLPPLRHSSYHELLCASTAAAVSAALRHDSLEAYEIGVDGGGELRELVEGLGLPAHTMWWAGGGAGDGGEGEGGTAGAGLALPLVLPFTRCVPALLRLLRTFVTDSLAFLKGLASPWELLQAVFHHRDRMVSRVLAEALSTKLATLNSPARLHECMRMAVNLWSLVASLDALDEWTVVRVRPTSGGGADGGDGGALRLPDAAPAKSNVPAAKTEGPAAAAAAAAAAARGITELQLQGQRRFRALRSSVVAPTGEGGPSNGAQSALVALQDAAERCVLRLASSRVEAILEVARAGVWLPPGPMPAGVSPYVEECLAYVREIEASGRAIMPRPSFLFLVRTLCKTIGLSFMRLFSPEKGIRAFNLCAIARLSSDLAAVQSWAEEVGVPNLSQEIAEPVQLCALLLSNKIEEMLVPDLRAQKYPNLEPSTILLVLDRYKELAKAGKDKTNFPTRRAIDIMAKTLRAQLVIIGTGHRVLEDL